MWDRWAIRHKPTGHFMPQSSKKRHGYTHDEPVTLDNSHHCPRLFAREQDAKTALTWWLKGETTVDPIQHGVNAWGEYDDWGGDWHTHEVADRKAEDFEVVRLRIGVVEPDIMRSENE